MEKKIIVEKEVKRANGGLMLLLVILAHIAAIAAAIIGGIIMDAGAAFELGVVLLVIGALSLCVLPILFAGFKVIQPNEARVFTVFGKYSGTIKKSGFFFVNPFSVSVAPTESNAQKPATTAVTPKAGVVATTPVKRSVSLKTQTLDNSKQKVNDVLGNPIIIGAVVIWRVVNPTEAVFAVENYKEYLSIQTDSIIRNTARLYPYDSFDEDDDDGIKEKSLRGSSLEIAENMKQELQAKVAGAGLEIEEIRITHLAYSEEIAAAMLQRQQAAAIIAARQKIVDGAVGMVKMAIEKLNEDNIIALDEERKAAMVSNLLVVLCGNKEAQPIVNSGSIY